MVKPATATVTCVPLTIEIYFSSLENHCLSLNKCPSNFSPGTFIDSGIGGSGYPHYPGGLYMTVKLIVAQTNGFIFFIIKDYRIILFRQVDWSETFEVRGIGHPSY
jgi:hypothetical protein